MSKGTFFQEATKDLPPPVREHLLLVLSRLGLPPDSAEIVLLAVAGHVMAAADRVPEQMRAAGRDVSAEVRKALGDVQATMAASKEAAKAEIEAGMVGTVDRLIQAAGANIGKAEASRWVLKTTLACLGGFLVTISMVGGLIWYSVNQAADARIQAEKQRLSNQVAGYQAELKTRAKWVADLTRDQYDAAQWAAGLTRENLDAAKWYTGSNAVTVRRIVAMAPANPDNAPFPCAGWGQQNWQISGKGVTTCIVVIGRK